MRTKTNSTCFRRSITTVAVGFALAIGSAPVAAAVPNHPVAANSAPVGDSGSSSGSGYLLEAALNALCLLTGSKPMCWGSVPTV
ncbi:hypothetical protein AB0M22_37695 [Nocardia sp. NPDC051756]|uniref:hypothetical protein n=1 Tax=Nocardia sp. NPDC051756 TaxID=3154751 RepID=UPI003414DC53